MAPPQYISAFVGKFNRTRSIEHSVWQIILHPGWHYEHIDADISLVGLRDEVVFSGGVRSICLHQSSFKDANIGAGFVGGWRKSNNSRGLEISPVEFDVIKQLKCASNFPYFPPSELQQTFCSSYVNISKSFCTELIHSCIYIQNTSTELFSFGGIVSATRFDHFDGCDLLFFNVSTFVDWIREKNERNKGNRMESSFTVKSNLASKLIKFKYLLKKILSIFSTRQVDCYHNFKGEMTRNLKIIPSDFLHFEPFENIINLEILNITFTPSKHIFDGFGGIFCGLKKLEISNQLIRFIERVNFACMSKLKALVLLGNEIEFVPDKVF